MTERFLKQLQQFFPPLSAEQRQDLEAILAERTIAPNTILIRPGQLADRMYFVAEGALRSYLLREGEDITDYFFFENSFATDYASLYGQKPAVFYLQALENCSIIQFRRNDFLALSIKHPVFETIARVTAERAFVEIEERMRLLHHENLETRYRWMMSRFPQVFQRAPQYQIASYLGVKPESLSRIKKTVGNRF